MKKYIILSITIFMYNVSLSQTTTFIKSEFKGDKYDFFGKHLQYPENLLMIGMQGNTIVSFRLNEKGVLDSIDVIASPCDQLELHIVEVLKQTQKLWTPTMVNGIAVPYRYKLVVRHVFYPNSPPAKEKSMQYMEKAEKEYSKEKYEKALIQINKAIALNSFISEYYKFRSGIYNSLNETRKAIDDSETASEMDRDIFLVMEVLGYKSVKTRNYPIN